MLQTVRHALRSLGPVIPPAHWPEALRAGLGALVGLSVVVLLAILPGIGPQMGFYLIAPFGASAVLLFAAPSSPLAQPWSVIVGNSASACVVVLVCMAMPDPFWRVIISVGAAIVVMILLRALHPPGGAVAMTAALAPDLVVQKGLAFALSPVAEGSITLVLIAILYARATGRRYPFRQFDDANTHGTHDVEPAQRLGLTEDELAGILTSYRQSLNLGVEDLARLIAAAEMQAASHQTGPLAVADIMSRDLVTVGPDATMAQVAALFRKHGFTSLPVVADEDRFLGVIFQLHLIRHAPEDGTSARRGLSGAMGRVLSRSRAVDLRAGQIMAHGLPFVSPDAPVATLLPMMAVGDCDAVPVLDRGRIVGIVTRTDLIVALARQSLRPAAGQDTAHPFHAD